MNTKYVSLDIETTGLNPENCQVLEIGAVIDDGTTPIEDCPTFQCYVDLGRTCRRAVLILQHTPCLPIGRFRPDAAPPKAGGTGPLGSAGA